MKYGDNANICLEHYFFLYHPAGKLHTWTRSKRPADG